MTTLVGITGSRLELPPAQREALWLTLMFLHEPGIELAQGDCENADAVAHWMATELGYITHVLPPTDPRYRAFLVGHHNYEPAAYMVRNNRIARMCTRLVAVPAAPEAASPRSGTWATVRMVRRLGKPIHLVWPSGRVEEDCDDDPDDGHRDQRDGSEAVDPGAVAQGGPGNRQ